MGSFACQNGSGRPRRAHTDSQGYQVDRVNLGQDDATHMHVLSINHKYNVDMIMPVFGHKICYILTELQY